jgi:hypothetical protein
MSKTTLKKHLLSLTKEQIVEMVLGLYDVSKPAREYFEYYLQPDEKGMFEKYRTIVINQFYPKGKFLDALPRFSVAKKAIADFRSLSPSPLLLADLMVTLAEMACKFTFDYGDMSEQYYNSAAKNFELALEFLDKHDLLDQFKLRCLDCVKYAEPCGYGFSYEIEELYDEYYIRSE